MKASILTRVRRMKNMRSHLEDLDLCTNLYELLILLMTDLMKNLMITSMRKPLQLRIMQDIDSQDKLLKGSQFQNHSILMFEKRRDLNQLENERLMK